MSLLSQAETDSDGRLVATRPPDSARGVLISMNPRAGSKYRSKRIGAIESALTRAGFDVQMTTDLAKLAVLARQFWQEGDLRAVIAMGGDGTASVVRNHVPLMVPMLTVPMGTENLLGRYTRQKSDASSVVRTMEDGVVVGLDLGRANGKYFLLMVSAGFDAEVVRSLHERRRGNIRRTAYLLPVLQTLRSYRYPEMELYWESAERPVRCRWLFGFNFPLYGLGLRIAPHALASDGALDVCAFERGTTWSIARYLWHLLLGGHLELPDSRSVPCKRFRVAALDSENVAYQLDGDHAGMLPVEVEVLPGELRLLVSRETAGRLGFTVPAK
jgi:diacylglycerol kinase family enzyme